MASWCGPCRAEIPEISAFADANPDVVVIGVAVEDRYEDFKQFVTEVGPTYAVGFDEGAMRTAYQTLGLPATVFLDSNGFHQSIIRMSRNSVLIDLAENLFTHMRMIRRKTIGDGDRADRSIRDHMNIIEALEARETARAEELVRDHALGLADHVMRHADYLD
jgi:thiol-disulfide isomerase/thioredoxin